jgi:hypothetical protein
MNNSRRYRRQLLTTLFSLVIVGTLSQTALAKDVRLEATYTLAANGDLAVVMKLTTSMDLYDKIRQSVSNLYLLLRNLSSQRAEMEVGDKKADWDDSTRTITISYKALGMARNSGNHWELDIPQLAEFSNLDEDQKTVYFTEEIASPLGTVTGRGRLILPKAAQQCSWDGNRRVVSYVMPVPKTSSGGKGWLWLPAGILLVAGAILTFASFAGRVKPTDNQLPPPQKLLNE